MSSGKKIKLSISLPAEMIDWLDSSVESQSLPSRSKAVRCCINCVALGDVPEINDTVSASKISTDYRALDIELASQQIEWVDSIRSKSKEYSSESEVVRSVIMACMNADQDVVFGVVRCKSKVTECGGARKAIDSLTERYGANGVVVKEEIQLL